MRYVVVLSIPLNFLAFELQDISGDIDGYQFVKPASKYTVNLKVEFSLSWFPFPPLPSGATAQPDPLPNITQPWYT